MSGVGAATAGDGSRRRGIAHRARATAGAHRRHEWIRIAVTAGVVAAALAGAPEASGAADRRVSAVLLTPNHRRVAPGRIRLVVTAADPAPRRAVFIAISPARRLDRFGHLTGICPVTDGCDFVEAGHWGGQRWVYVAGLSFAGYWAVTPGRYYWQAHYYVRTAVHYSGIGWFVVR
jgi:hypothetical protein